MVARQALALLALVPWSWGCGGGRKPEAAPPDPAVGAQVALVLPSVDGGEVDLGRFRGRSLVLHVASTASLDAQADVEELRQARERRPELALVEMVYDEGGDRLALPWAYASAIDWVVVLPTAEVRSGQSALGPIAVVPTTFFLDAQGRVVWRWQGALRGRLLSSL